MTSEDGGVEMAILGLQFWAFIGTFYLILLTFQDYKNKGWVDDRRNWFMMGATIMIISHIGRNFWIFLAVIALSIGLNIYFKKKKVLGDADINSLSWMIIGFGLINVWNLIFFLMIFIVLTTIYNMLKIWVFKYRGSTPFYFVMLLSFAITCFSVGLYFS